MSMRGPPHLEAMFRLEHLRIERYLARNKPFSAYRLADDLDYNACGILIGLDTNSAINTMIRQREQTVKVLFPQYGCACLEIRSKGEFEQSDTIECTLLYSEERKQKTDPIRRFLAESGFEPTDAILDPRKHRAEQVD